MYLKEVKLKASTMYELKDAVEQEFGKIETIKKSMFVLENGQEIYYDLDVISAEGYFAVKRERGE